MADAHRPADSEILAAFPEALLVIDAAEGPCLANAAAESLFSQAAASLSRTSLAALCGSGSLVCDIVRRVRDSGGVVTARDVAFSGRLAGRRGDIKAAPVGEAGDFVLLLLEERQVPDALARRTEPAGAARSAAGLAAMLAHEIRNPLSGIRGAAQLLEKGAETQTRSMAGLIRSEVDRIRGLVDQLERFSDTRPIERAPVNIHTVLDHVCAVAAAGPAGDRRIRKAYDPSLPAVLGERDRLVQIFLNLVKNAVEATAEQGGEIRIATAYRQGVRVVGADGTKTHLPIAITVADDGHGIPADLAEHLFEPFVTGREGGSGLGLAMVAKLVGEHGGLVECEPGSAGQGALFRVLLPAAEMAGRDG